MDIKIQITRPRAIFFFYTITKTSRAGFKICIKNGALIFIPHRFYHSLRVGKSKKRERVERAGTFFFINNPRVLRTDGSMARKQPTFNGAITTRIIDQPEKFFRFNRRASNCSWPSFYELLALVREELLLILFKLHLDSSAILSFLSIPIHTRKCMYE